MTSSSALERDLPAAIAFVGAAFVLVLLTVLHVFGAPRFVAAGAALEPLGGRPLQLANGDPARTARRDFRLPLPAAPYVEVVVVAVGRDIQGAGQLWHQGRVVLLGERADGGRRWDLPHVVARLSGSDAPERQAARFRLSADAVSLLLRIELLRATGRLDVRSVTVTPLDWAPGYKAGERFLVGGWVLLGLGFGAFAFRRARRGRPSAALALLAAVPVLLISVLPGELGAPARLIAADAARAVGVEAGTAAEVEAAVWAQFFLLAKTTHVLMFLFAGFVFALARGRLGLWPTWAIAAGFGVVAEFLQVLSPDRSPSLLDVGLNVAGASAGVALAVAATALWRRFRSRRPA